MRHRVIANYAIVFAAAWLATIGGATAQDVVMEAPPGMDNGVLPMTLAGEGSYFSQDLGTMLRLRYNTESYGQTGRGNFDIGTMQVWSLDTSAAFFDGQVTLNELQGVGYNLGVGYRWLSTPAISRGAGRMGGLSLWTDGQSTNEGNFFPQIGLSLESLGDIYDFRANGYLPLGPESQTGEFSPTGVTGFQGNSISEITQAVVNTSYAVAEMEAARRLGSERDAWAFAGPYFVGNEDDDAVGYRVGVRGYAYPDLLLQIAVTDDEIFKTNATFSVTWFVGRTRTDFQPACGVPDRIREPVLRNDYVVLSQSFATGGIPLTQPDGSALRIVHVDSDAPEGGDGTFEDPFNQLTDVNDGGSLTGDVILAHALSVFNDEATSVVLKDNQRLLGEGAGVEHTVATLQEGTLIIPETFAGARTSTRPLINGAAPGSDAITLADTNEVNNFTIDGQDVTVQAIASQTLGSGNPVLRNLEISNTLGDAIHLTPLEEDDTDDRDNDGNFTEKFIRGNVTIDDVTFTSIGDGVTVGGDPDEDIDINSLTVNDVTLPNVNLSEVISITDITSNNNQGRSIAIANTHAGAGRTATINNFTYNGGGDSLGAIVLSNFDSTFNASNSTLREGNINGAGALIEGDSDGSMTFASTVVFDNLGGTAVDINGSDGATDALGGTININGVINNGTIADPGTGRSVRIRNMASGAVVNFAATADITHVTTGANTEGVLITDNSGGTVTFNGDLKLTTDGSTAFDVNEAGNDVTIAAPSAANSITQTNTLAVANIAGLRIIGANIGGAGVNFPDFNATGGLNGAVIENNTNTANGAITLGLLTDDAGESGIINATGDGIVIRNSANVTVSGIEINNTAGDSGVLIDKTTTVTDNQIVNLNNLKIDDGGFGIEVTGNGTGQLTLTVNDSEINNSTDAGISTNNIDTGPIQINNTVLDGGNLNATQDGIRITDSDAQITIDINPASDNTVIREFGGDEFEVDNALPNVTMNGSIVNTSGRSVFIRRVDGGTVTFGQTSSIDDEGAGVLIGGTVADGNAGGTFSFLGTNVFDTDADDAVTFQNNTVNTSAIFEDLAITTGNGDGVVIAANASTTSVRITGVDVTSTGTGDGINATGAGELTILGANNVLEIDDGVGLRIEGLAIGGSGVTLQEVDVADGDTNAIVLRNLTGTGQVTVGTLAGNASELTTEGDAIVLENVANADFNNVQVVNATDASSQGVDIDHSAGATTTMDITFNNLTVTASDAEGIDVDAASTQIFNLRLNNSTLTERVTMDNSGSGAFRVLLNNTDIDITGSANTDDALVINFNSGTADGDVTIQGGSEILADGGRALEMAVSGAASVEMLIENTTFDSNGAEDLFLVNTVGAKTDATIRNNTFDAGGAPIDVQISSTGSAALGTRLDLNLFGNGPDSNTDIELSTDEDAVAPSNFGVVDLPNVDDNNPADVTLDPPSEANFDNIPAADVELPNGP